eukprot:INCI3475.1.p1 GENE.INCI3475.1~~INCI3475.1.p1  ORF type:complete len:208 (+),score=35.62 INCI3475.1:123-746(+)
MSALATKLRQPHIKIIFAGAITAISVAQIITGSALGGDVYSWGICAFSLLTGFAGISYGGYSLFRRGDVDRELAFALCVSILLANLQSTFVLGACTAPLAESYAVEILGIYEEVVDEILTKECSDCLNTEDTIEAQVLVANSQNFGGEAAFLVLSILQVILLGIGCFVNFDNHALGELDVVPNSCLSLQDNKAPGSGEHDELGFDEL